MLYLLGFCRLCCTTLKEEGGIEDGYARAWLKMLLGKKRKKQADKYASRQAGRLARKGTDVPLQPELDLLTVMFFDGFP
jgi:hypothetical protein